MIFFALFQNFEKSFVDYQRFTNRTKEVFTPKVEFKEDEKKVDWVKDGTFDAKAELTSDSEKEDLIWEIISGTPTATIDTNGLVSFSSDNKYDTESEGTYVITARHKQCSDCQDVMNLKVVAYLKVPIILKRKNISLKEGDDKYGHWWAEISGSESYGWWPDRYVDIWDTLTSVPGDLNGQITYGGTPSLDPHHGDSAEETIQTYIKSHDKTIDETKQAVRDFAYGYSGTWSWPFGQNCHSFQESMTDAAKLIKESETND